MVVNQNYYSRVENVIAATGVAPRDFELKDDKELYSFIEGYLIQIRGIINRDRNRDFSTSNTYDPITGKVTLDTVPSDIHLIAETMAVNQITYIKATKDSAWVKKEDGTLQKLYSRIITKEVRELLDKIRPVSFPFFQ